MFFESTIACFIVMVDACSPVFVQTIISAGVKSIVTDAPVGGFVADKDVADPKTPNVVGGQRNVLIGDSSVPVLKTVTNL